MTYKIIRFFHPSQNKEPEDRAGGLTKQEAMDHCEREDTRKEGVYFDGWTNENE